MNLFGCLFPCALQHSWRSGENQQCMSERLTHRMGVNASTSPGNDPTMVPVNLGNESSVTGYRDTIGVVRLVSIDIEQRLLPLLFRITSVIC